MDSRKNKNPGKLDLDAIRKNSAEEMARNLEKFETVESVVFDNGSAAKKGKKKDPVSKDKKAKEEQKLQKEKEKRAKKREKNDAYYKKRKEADKAARIKLEQKKKQAEKQAREKRAKAREKEEQKKKLAESKAQEKSLKAGEKAEQKKAQPKKETPKNNSTVREKAEQKKIRPKKEKPEKNTVAREKTEKNKKAFAEKASFKLSSVNLNKKVIAVSVCAVALIVVISILSSFLHVRSLTNKVKYEYSGIVQVNNRVMDINVPEDDQKLLIKGTKSFGTGKKFPFYCLREINFRDGSADGTLSLGNPADSGCVFLVTVMGKDGGILYRSDGINPGKCLETIKLFIPGAKGESKARVFVTAYDINDTDKIIGVRYTNIKINVLN
ncbi:MAG: hypothetical protein K6F09_07175 [Clostridiales bacterium]|nr:hypothetical protein [Clostridiales bacterium]